MEIEGQEPILMFLSRANEDLELDFNYELIFFIK